jgi:hypothetical protein
MNVANVALAQGAIARHRDVVVGVKARLSENVADANDLEALRRAQEAAAPFNLPVMIHIGQSFSPMRAILSVALAPWLGSSPERSSRSALNRRMSAARRPGSGDKTTSAKAVRNPPASVSGNPIRSSGTRAGRRIATGSPTKNVPRAVVRPAS